MRVTGIGGGHGLAASLRAARAYADEVSAVVTVADDGGSSGRLTRDLGIPPPGDIRNCLVALADDSELTELYQHRFKGGALTGHTLGNLLIAALTESSGDFVTAVERAGTLLGSQGAVYPATSALVTLRARVRGGVVSGQVAVAQTTEQIQAIYLDPVDPPACEQAVEMIAAADQIVMGPGSLFTSLIATLLVPGIRAAVRESKAVRVFVCNSRMQKGETTGYDAAAHVEALIAHAGSHIVDAVIVQDPVASSDGVALVEDGLATLGVDVVRADVADNDGGHDPRCLAEVLRKLF